MSDERFVVHITGVPISPATRERIENAINETVKTELARIDTKGDLEVTPLSGIKSYGAGAGSATAGMFVRGSE